MDVRGRRLFIAALGNNTLEVIDLAAGKRIQSVAGMSKPTGVLYLPESNRLFVANGVSVVVSVFGIVVDSPPIYLLVSLVPWCVIFSLATTLLAVLFKRMERASQLE